MTDAALERELLAQRAFVRALARRLARDRAAADDLEQETLRAALARPARSDGELRPWLATLARNAARRAWRADRRRGERERAAARAEAQPATDQLVERAHTMRHAVEAVLALPPRQREVVLLRFYEGRSVRAVAERLGETPEVVKSRTARALRALRARLDEAHDGRRGAWLLGLLPGAGAKPAALATMGVLMTVRTAAVVGVALLVGLGVWWQSQDALEPEAAPELVGHEQEEQPPGSSRVSVAAPDAQREPAGAPPPRAASDAVFVRGRVVDRLGEPVVGALVAVLGEEDPFEGRHERMIGWNQYRGAEFTTDGAGRFAAVLARAQRVLVTVGYSPRYTFDYDDPPERWVDAPAEGIELVVARQATATLRAHLIDGETGELIEDFRAVVQVEGGMHTSSRSVAGLTEWELAVPEPQGITLTLSLLQPEGPEPLIQTLHLSPGESREVELVLGGEGALVGRVVDRQGLPIAGALVWYGLVADGRGDEPFKPFDPSRISGVRSGVDGRFRLPGGGRLVSAWHEQYGTYTDEAERATRIALPPRGEIRGLVRDAEGQPVAGLALTLDREPKGRTDADGRFAIEHVEAGVRGLTLGDQRSFAVRVQPGRVSELTIDPGLPELRLEFARDGVIVPRKVEGALIGLGEPADVEFLYPGRGGERARALGIAPGPYLYLGADGAVAYCELDVGSATVELGAAELVVHTDPRAQYGVAPVDSDELVHLLAARLAPRADANGELRLGPLAPGAYHVVGHAGRVEARVEVTTPTTELSLNAR